MQLIKAFKGQAKIEGLIKKTLVSIEVESDDVDFSYWDEEAKNDTIKSLDKGLTECLWVKVTVRFADLAHFEGSDSLGQVFVRSNVGYSKDIMQTVSIHDMVQNATDDLVAQVLQGKSQIDTFLTKVA